MKASTIASTLAIFSAALAAPAPAPAPQSGTPSTTEFFTFSLINDQTGASASRWIQINAPQPFVLGQIFSGATNLIKNGKLTATSAQNIRPGVQDVFCIFKTPSGQVIRINDEVTNADLDGNPGKAIETDVSLFTIECQK